MDSNLRLTDYENQRRAVALTFSLLERHLGVAQVRSVLLVRETVGRWSRWRPRPRASARRRARLRLVVDVDRGRLDVGVAHVRLHVVQRPDLHGERPGWRIDKPTPRTNIDAMIGLCMAVDRAEHKPERVEPLAWL